MGFVERLERELGLRPSVCPKKGYETREDAEAELARIKKRTKGGELYGRPKTECRAYYCWECRSWHLTASKDRKL